MNNKYHELIRPKLPELAEFLNSGKPVSMAAQWLGVSNSTLRRYRKQYPELEMLFKQRSALCDDLVEAALLKRATGYEDSNGKEIDSHHLRCDQDEWWEFIDKYVPDEIFNHSHRTE